jgi:hypothetical protein
VAAFGSNRGTRVDEDVGIEADIHRSCISSRVKARRADPQGSVWIADLSHLAHRGAAPSRRPRPRSTGAQMRLRIGQNQFRTISVRRLTRPTPPISSSGLFEHDPDFGATSEHSPELHDGSFRCLDRGVPTPLGAPVAVVRFFLVVDAFSSVPRAHRRSHR